VDGEQRVENNSIVIPCGLLLKLVLGETAPAVYNGANRVGQTEVPTEEHTEETR
jgi:hypothetical protein